MKNKVFRKSILILLVISLLLPILSVFMISASAATSDEDYYEGFPLEVDYDKYANYDEALEGETNSEKGAGGAYTIPVSVNSPQITVLIHGFAGKAADWSNDISLNNDTALNNKEAYFSYNGKSLVEKIRKGSNAKIYYAKSGFEYNEPNKDSNGYVSEGTLKGNKQFYLYECPDRCECAEGSTYCTCVEPYAFNESISKITDISQHMVIVFEASDPTGSNDRIYEELNYIIDKIVYDFRTLNDGILPKLNLIAHSRGSITAMQYALDHPLLVSSLITIGGVFNGSKLGEYEFFLNLLGWSSDRNTSTSKGDFSFGIEDILNFAKNL